MKFSVLALDFDGTIAEHDRLEPAVATAIADLRARGVTVILATGRILTDLERVVGDLTFVDAIVAENGAVVTFPASGYQTVAGTPPSPELFGLLQADGIGYDRGQVVVETDAKYAMRLIDIIRHLELPLVLAFNRSRLMLLPQAVSKATGMRQALSILRLSARNTVAIGDAENDHELIGLAELGVAVAWGSLALQQAADRVLPGSGPADVAPFIRELGVHLRIPTPLHTRRQLLVGRTESGEPLALAVRGRNVLVAGDAKSGKSWVTGLLAEQLILHGYSLCLIDPEGDYHSLEALPGVVVMGRPAPPPRPMELLRALRHADTSVVIDLSHVAQAEKIEYVRTLLPALAAHRRHTGLPHRIVIDEAHYFLHDSDAETLLDLQLNGYTMVSYRASRLHPSILAASQAILVTRESDGAEILALQLLCRSCSDPMTAADFRRLLGGLRIGEAVMLPVTDETHGQIRRIALTRRLTPHVRHLTKYFDFPVVGSKAFLFWPDDRPGTERTSTLRSFAEVLDRMPARRLDGHLRRRDFSRWIAQVFGDHALAETVGRLEDRFCEGQAPDAPKAIASAVRDRYEFVDRPLA